MIVAEMVFWGSLLMLCYLFVGYPVLALTMGVVRQRPHSVSDSFRPTVTLIISAYNEEKDIREKLENTRQLHYPKDKLEVLVISDASSDQTDAIVREYEHEGIILRRMAERGGKTVGLNAVVPSATGEFIVFSDANAIYRPDAIEKLIRNFCDPAIGCVTGDSQYINVEDSSAGKSEKTYWDYDRLLKVRESRSGSMVGSDGAIFAIRKELYAPLRPEDINDFVLPLLIVSQGYRCIFEPEAVCEESGTSHWREEFRRKIRVVNRSWTGLWRVKQLLNPYQYGWFSIQLFSHKLLRWLTPLFLFSLLASSISLVSVSPFFLVMALSQLGGYTIGIFGMVFEKLSSSNRLVSVGAYFLLVNVASVLGIIKGLRGNTITVWNPERQHDQPVLQENRAGMLHWALLLALGGGLVASIVVWPERAFWIAGFALIYVYIGYPMLSRVLALCFGKPWKKEDIIPPVTLLIVAYNEQDIIEDKIKNSLSLNYPSDQLTIMVCSDGSTDETNAILSRYQDRGITAHMFPVRSGKMSVINQVVPLIKSEIVVFSDANTMYMSDCILKLVRNFADEQVGAVSGKVNLVDATHNHGLSEKLYWKYEWLIHKTESTMRSQIGVDGAMYAIRRELFLGAMNNVVNDDLVIGLKVAMQGKRVVFEGEAIGYEASEETLKGEFQRRVRITAGAVQSILNREVLPGIRQLLLLFQFFSHKVLRWAAPLALLCVFLSCVMLIQEPFYRLAFIGQSLFYSLGLLGYLIRSTTSWFSVPMYFCAMNLAVGVGLVWGFLARQQGTWDRLERRRWAL
jgi:cellulose synthase/poly-beta-1,6-N-acetylglucosamine synthase-like glycosyltransferase